MAVRRPGPRAFRLFIALSLLALASRPVAADPAADAADLIRYASPRVRAALESPDGAAGRDGLATLLASGRIPPYQLRALLAMRGDFASEASRTFAALAKVDRVKGVGRTIEALIDGNGNIGHAVEIQVAAAFGAEQVAQIGADLGTAEDPLEVDVLLVDGTRVEVKSYGGKDPSIIERVADKGIEQLALRSAGGEKTILVTRTALAPATMDDLRKRLGATARVMVLHSDNVLREQVHAPSGQVAARPPAPAHNLLPSSPMPGAWQRHPSMRRTRSAGRRVRPWTRPPLRRVH